jgi:Trk K+ transport system NAD-binding subunit
MDAVSDHVVVFGYHGLARRVVRQLVNAGQHVLVVDPEASTVAVNAFRHWGVDYLRGSGRSRETLAEANVAAARAVVCVKDDDLRNIETAMLVREMSADVRIVVQMANSSVGRALHAIATPGAVIDVAELASSAFVEAALDRTTHAVRMGGVEFLIETVQVSGPGSLRDLWGDLAPIAMRRTDDTGPIACPGRDELVKPGDLVTFIGTERDYRGAHLDPQVQRGTLPGPTLRRRAREVFAAVSDAVDRPFRIAFAVLIGLAVVSVIVLTSLYEEPDGTRMNPLDAIYFTAETLATVGFGDFYFRDQAPALRLWAVFLILVGASLVALSTALLTNALVSRRLAQSLGRQRMIRMRDHIVVVGLGSIGSKVAADLRADGYEVAVIDGGAGQRLIPQMNAIGVPVLIGDATLRETQASVSLERAAGVAILTSDDLMNIETGLAVRDVLGDADIPVVMRNYSHSLARGVDRALSIGVARSPTELAAPWFVGAALGLDILGTFYVGSTPFMAARVPVRSGGGLDGIAMEELGVRARIVAISRDGVLDQLEHPPRRQTVLRGGDNAYAIGEYEELLHLLHRATAT